MGFRRFLWNVIMKVLSMMSKDAKVIYSSIRELEIPRVYLKSQKEEKDESNVEKKWYNKCRRK